VAVPPNTTATVRLPGAQLDEVSEGGKTLAGRAEFSAPRQDGDSAVIDIGSGTYVFESPYQGGAGKAHANN
jgi:alpha-L-rhamnosidase